MKMQKILIIATLLTITCTSKSQSFSKEDSCFTRYQLEKLSQTIDEFEALEVYNKRLIDVNNYLNKKIINCEQTVESYEKSEQTQKEIDKNMKKKCNSIKVQRDIYGITSIVFGVAIIILLI